MMLEIGSSQFCGCCADRSAAYAQFAAVVNEKKQKLRDLQQRVQELENMAQEDPDQVCQLSHEYMLRVHCASIVIRKVAGEAQNALLPVHLHL